MRVTDQKSLALLLRIAQHPNALSYQFGCIDLTLFVEVILKMEYFQWLNTQKELFFSSSSNKRIKFGSPNPLNDLCDVSEKFLLHPQTGTLENIKKTKLFYTFSA
jgi:hypothetical protein